MKKMIIDFSKKHNWFRILLRKIIFLKNLLLNMPNLFNKVKNNLVVFESYMGRNYDCSPRAIYENMLDDIRFKDYEFVWVFRKPYEGALEKDYKKDARTRVVVYRSKEYYKVYSKAKYWVTNSRLPEELFKKKGQVYVQCWHGTPLKRLGHDVVENTQNAMNNKKDIRKKYDIESSKFDYFLSPSKFASEKFMTAFNIQDEKKIIEEGYPRNDDLLKANDEIKEDLKIKLGLPLDKKVILYAPTWRDNQHDANIGYTYKVEIDFAYLQKELGNEYIILYRPHYLVANSVDVSQYEGFVYYDSSYVGNTNDLYIVSDILITDYSSAFFDYANLDRPVIFYMYDMKFYEEELRGFYLSLDELPGEIVVTEKELIKVVKNIEKKQLELVNKYQKFKNKYNYLDDGKAALRVINKIFEVVK